MAGVRIGLKGRLTGIKLKVKAGKRQRLLMTCEHPEGFPKNFPITIWLTRDEALRLCAELALETIKLAN